MNVDFIAYPMGQFLNFIYNTIALHNYGLAIIFFTIFIRLILLPLTIKQYHSMTKTQQLQPQILEIQKKYKNDKEKLNMELMKFYKENNVNPAGGCLPLLIQMPILIALYWVISSPLKFMLRIDTAIIRKLAEAVKTLVPSTVLNAVNPDIGIIMYLKQIGTYGNVPGQISKLINETQFGRIANLNLEFLGINLGMTPSWDPSRLFGASTWQQYLPLLIIPILVAVSTYLQSKIMSKMQKTSNQAGAAASMQNSMMIIMPLMLLLFSFSVPAGLGLYWTVGNIIQIFTQIYINNTILNKKEVQKK